MEKEPRTNKNIPADDDFGEYIKGRVLGKLEIGKKYIVPGYLVGTFIAKKKVENRKLTIENQPFREAVFMGTDMEKGVAIFQGETMSRDLGPGLILVPLEKIPLRTQFKEVTEDEKGAA